MNASVITRPIGPYSKPHTLAKLDGRRREAKAMARIRAGLIEHVGGRPSIVQELLIERMVRLWMQLDSFDRKMAGGVWTDHGGRVYGGCLNAYRLVARELGMKGAGQKPLPSLAEHMARRAAEQGAKARAAAAERVAAGTST